MPKMSVSSPGSSGLSSATLAEVYASLGGQTSGESTIPLNLVTNSSLTMTSGVMILTYFRAWKTETITQLKWFPGGTSGSGLTLTRFGIYSVAGGVGNGDLTLIASTAADSTSAWTGSSEYTRALSGGSFSKVQGTWYAVGCLFVGTTMPAVAGVSIATGSIIDEGPRTGGQVASLSDIPGSVSAASIASNTRRQALILLP